ncbi:hypothetical protein [Halorhabdus sp. CUG00001]|uniref:hypothetical protein n=1 Tax=Halorhabdus sp. CUG00001 TaxID=2600297 RepID=UPI00131CC87F|nr:hypothetical protein [Halorhabdus sp. CUG00001]
MPDYHAQDWLLITEALVSWAGNPNDLETPRQRRAWTLAEEIAAEQGLAPGEALLQIDDDWSG